MYDPQAVGFWAVVSVANFRGDNDTEQMSLSNIEGNYARQKPAELMGALEGLVCNKATPTLENVRQIPKVLLSTQENTQDLLGALQASTQAATPRASAPTTPESSGSGKRSQTGGKAPRAEHSKKYADKTVELTSEDDEGDSSSSTEDEEELPSHQPETKQRASPPIAAKPAKGLVQTQLTASLGSSKKRKLEHVSTEDNEEATTIRFSGSNMTQAQLNKLVETAFLKAQNEPEASDGEPKAKRGRKVGSKNLVTKPVKAVVVKPGSSASSEQKGKPLFMNGPDNVF